MNFAVILAAGLGKRMKGADKIFYKIQGKPLLFYTLKAFENHPQIKKIILIARSENFEKFNSLIKVFKFKKVASIAEGGKERQDSSFLGLKAAEKLGAKSGDLILFHNVANPLVSQKEISEVVRVARLRGASLVGQYARDTIKEIDEKGFVSRTLDRKKIFMAQTPQAMEYRLAKRAFEKAFQDNFQGTDDVSLAEKLGVKVKAVEASSRNVKVTYPEDLTLVKILLKR